MKKVILSGASCNPAIGSRSINEGGDFLSRKVEGEGGV